MPARKWTEQYNAKHESQSSLEPPQFHFPVTSHFPQYIHKNEQQQIAWHNGDPRIFFYHTNSDLSPSDFAPASSKEFLDIQATIECGFTLKNVCDMTRTYSQSPHLVGWVCSSFQYQFVHQGNMKIQQYFLVGNFKSTLP